eukprot:gene33185-40150_t
MDRLNELKRNAAAPDDVNVDLESDRGLVSNGARSTSGAKQSDHMQEFFNDVELVKANIVVVKEATRKIAEINQNVLQATTTDK